MTGKTRIPWAARSPTTASDVDQFQVPRFGSMCYQFMIQRTVVAPLALRENTSLAVMSLK